MNISHKLTMELTQNCSSNIIYAVQGDTYSRTLELTILANGMPWIIPEDITALIRYSKPDGKGGVYDTLPDETPAWTATENVMLLTLAPQVLTAPGTVKLAVTFLRGTTQVSTFSIIICVEPAVNAADVESDAQFHIPGILPAPVSAEVGQYLQIAAVDPAGHVTVVKGAALEKDLGMIVEPGDGDIPKVFFGAALPQSKYETIMSFRYISKTEDISGYCKTKAQGNSSLNYPKKNQTVTLYRDAACTEKLDIDFKGWGKQNQFCFRANWIDLTHARNIVSAKLWGDVVKSRGNYDEIPELLRTSPNHGAVDGFPVKVYAGGIYQGRYTINIPKDAWMANMDAERVEHCILCSENDVSGCFRAEANIDASDWTDEVHETVPESIRTRWNEAIRFVMNSTDDAFAAGIRNYFDVDSLIDYYLFGLASCGLDAFGKNQLYMTYDGQKWFATMYDMDSTWGLWWNGANFVPADYTWKEFQDLNDGEGNLLYMRLKSLFADSIKARWEELKTGALSAESIINRFERFTDITPPYLVEEDYAASTADGAYAEIPLQDTNNIRQIRQYAVDRLEYCDEFIRTLGRGALYPLISGSYTVPSAYATITVSKGNHVRIRKSALSWNLNYNVNIHDIATSAGNFTNNNFIHENLFSLKKGDTVFVRKRNTVVVSESENLPQRIHVLTLRKGDGTVSALNCYPDAPIAADVENTFTVASDFDVGCIGLYLNGGDGTDCTYTIDFDVEIYVNGTQYI